MIYVSKPVGEMSPDDLRECARDLRELDAFGELKDVHPHWAAEVCERLAGLLDTMEGRD